MNQKHCILNSLPRGYRALKCEPLLKEEALSNINFTININFYIQEHELYLWDDFIRSYLLTALLMNESYYNHISDGKVLARFEVGTQMSSYKIVGVLHFKVKVTMSSSDHNHPFISYQLIENKTCKVSLSDNFYHFHWSKMIKSLTWYWIYVEIPDQNLLVSWRALFKGLVVQKTPKHPFGWDPFMISQLQVKYTSYHSYRQLKNWSLKTDSIYCFLSRLN